MWNLVVNTGLVAGTGGRRASSSELMSLGLYLASLPSSQQGVVNLLVIIYVESFNKNRNNNKQTNKQKNTWENGFYDIVESDSILIVAGNWCLPAITHL